MALIEILIHVCIFGALYVGLCFILYSIPAIYIGKLYYNNRKYNKHTIIEIIVLGLVWPVSIYEDEIITKVGKFMR